MAMMGEDVLEALKENIAEIGHIQFADCPGRHQPIPLPFHIMRFFNG
jgi:Hydroxypyruvate isomerase